jgi:hypothetical protein
MNAKERNQIAIDAAKAILKSNGYFVDNLWHTDDVIQKYNCDEETALDILSRVFHDGRICERIFDKIDSVADLMGLNEEVQ